jgi:DNA topoisomerase VI subunit A
MSVNKSIVDLVRKTSKNWTRQRKAEERAKSAFLNRRARMIRSSRITVKQAAFGCMEAAYLAASANGRLWANARQIMYQARPTIQNQTGEQLNDQYFTQVLLPSYIEERRADWKVAYDNRGHFVEPHTKKAIGLGTLAVRSYLHEMHGPQLSEPTIEPPTVATCGPEARFGAVLFIEKEGFLQLFESVQLAERFDIAIMSTKGQSVTAARELVERLCARNVPLLVLHDFDKSGFSILGGLRESNRRYQYGHRHRQNVIDLGLRLDDVNELDLEAEAAFDRGSEFQRKMNLRKNGATPEEIKFLLEQRVELNAMASDQLVEWLEKKLVAHGVKKIIPASERLVDMYRLAAETKLLEASLAEAMEKARAEAARLTIPDDLHDRVHALLEENPENSWDYAITEIASKSLP